MILTDTVDGHRDNIMVTNKRNDMVTPDQAADFVGALLAIADTKEARHNPIIAEAIETIKSIFIQWYGDNDLAVDLGEYIGDVKDSANGKPYPTIEKTRNATIDFFDGTLGYKNDKFIERFGSTKTNNRW